MMPKSWLHASNMFQLNNPHKFMTDMLFKFKLS